MTDRGSLADALEEYLSEVEAGRTPDREQFLSKHPEVADELGPCLTALDLVQDPAPAGVDLEAKPLGDFRITRQIGRGGMGVVYEAEQLSLRRRVALKVLPFAGILDPRHLQRFRNEAQAAAHLHHTNIVPVYSVGCERGVHYYAMQFIDGLSVAEMIAELRETAGRDQPRTASSAAALQAVTGGRSTKSPEYCRAVARLGVQTARALDHAHEQGVVHRDVKPANLIVDTAGQVWITDFGLASFRGASGPTMSGDLVGTVRYMSPEQALAKRVPIDHRTDVYSLGVTLYELLTLETAFPGEDPHRVIQEIAFKSPTAPRRINPAVPAELETIVGKAIAKSPDDRYATAADLAQDLERYLEHRPIAARRPGPVKLLAQWSRRHRAVVWAGAMVLLLAALSAGIASVLVWRAYQDEASERARAEDNLGLFLRGLDEVALPLTERTLLGREEPTAAERDAMRDLLGIYEEFVRSNREHPAAREALADAHCRMGRLHAALGDDEPALVQQRHALDLAADLLDESPGDRRPWMLVSRCSRELAHHLDTMGCSTESADLWQQAEELALGLADEFPEDTESLECLWRFHNVASFRSGATDRHLHDALAVAERLVALDRDDVEHRARLGASLCNVANRQLDVEADPERACELYGRARATMTEALERRNEDRRGVHRTWLATTCYGYASALWRTRRFDEARDVLREAARVSDELLQAYPGRISLRLLCARILWRRSIYLPADTLGANPITLRRKAIEELEALVRNHQEDDAVRACLAGFLVTHAECSKPGDEAIEAGERAAELLEDLAERWGMGEWRGDGVDSPIDLEKLRLWLARARIRNARLRALTGGWEQGEPLLREAEATLTRWVGEDPGSADYEWLLCESRILLWKSTFARGRRADSLDWQRCAVETYDKLRADHPGTDSRSRLLTSRRLAITLEVSQAAAGLGNQARAEELARSVVEALRGFDPAGALGPGPRWRLAESIDFWALTLQALQRYGRARKALDEAGAIWEELDHPLRFSVNRSALATQLILVERDYLAAEAPALRAVELLEAQDRDAPSWRSRPMNAQILSRSRYFLWSVYHHTGRARMARDVARKMLDPDPANVYANWLNEVAWALVVAHEPEGRDPETALRLAEAAVGQAPAVGALWITLGVARYYTGAYTEAIEALERSRSNGGDTAIALLFLAMSHRQLGDQVEARERYGQALRSIEEHPSEQPEMERFRAEAEKLIE